jgi:glycosyltransferase involved in cell wall biosynthesis
MAQVSVIITAYNSERFLAEAIESVLAQTFRDFEVLVVDDGSTDGTGHVVRRYGASVRYIRQENRGQSAARNNGIRAARGEFIAFLDADDLWLSDKLERQMRAFTSFPAAGLVTGGLIMVDGQGKALKKVALPPYPGREALLERITVRGMTVATPSCVMARRECFTRAGLFDEQMHAAEDRDLWLRITRLYEAVFLPGFLIRYRIHDANIHRDIERVKRNQMIFLRKHLPGTPWLTRCKAYSYLYLDAAREYEAGRRPAQALLHAAASCAHYPLKVYPEDDKYQILTKALLRLAGVPRFRRGGAQQ